MKLNFETNIAEGTPEELVEYLRLVEEGEKKSDNQVLAYGHAHKPVEPEVQATFKGLLGSLGSLVKVATEYTDSTEEAEEPSTELKVGDRVKVLKIANGAVGEATVTAVFEGGNVEIAGKSLEGTYLPNWSSHVSFLEKIEEEDVEVEPEEADGLLEHEFCYLDGTALNNNVVLEVGTDYLEDSTGRRYTYQAVSGYAKPIEREDVRVKFDEAENRGVKLRYYPKAENVFVL